MKLFDLFKKKPRFIEEWPIPFKEARPFEEIHVRDPFIVTEKDGYVLTGTICNKNISDGYGVPIYKSKDLKTWSGPYMIVEQSKGYEQYSHYWAPEIHKVDNQYWLLVTLMPEGGKRGTYLFTADKIDGTYTLRARVTPEDMFSLDGTYYEENGKKYIVYCYEWVEATDGHVRAVELKEDLSGIKLETDRLLFKASSNVFHPRLSPNKVTDGPFLYKDGGKLKMLWSTGGNKNYLLLNATSTGGLFDKWEQESLLFEDDGGHGMIFTTHEGEKKIVIHAPNGKNEKKGTFEHPVILPFGKPIAINDKH